MWRGRATTEKAGQYVQHATGTVFPKLGKVEGHRGAYLLRRAINGAVEFVVLTLWESMDAVRRFAGADMERAVVEPEAQSVLSGFDEFVTHFEIVHGAERRTG
jgi:heme-degrading monooxygenase HmoA